MLTHSFTQWKNSISSYDIPINVINSSIAGPGANKMLFTTDTHSNLQALLPLPRLKSDLYT